MLRDITSMVAAQMRGNACIIDNEMELAGNQLLPHKCIGRARRLHGNTIAYMLYYYVTLKYDT